MQNKNEGDNPKFGEIGIHSTLLNVLTKKEIDTPSPIQHQAIPLALEGKDLMGIAQTGTGKTFAFGLPLLQHLLHDKRRGLILVPTRELAYQVEESLLPFAKACDIGIAVFIGGVPKREQRRMLKRNPRILVATPGRLDDHLREKTVSLSEVDILVLDEADRMLDMGFKPQITSILKHVPTQRQTMLFSATMPQEIVKLAQSYMDTPLRIEVAPQGTTAAKVEQELIIVKQVEKGKLLKTLLKENDGQVIVFTRTKYGAKKVTRYLNDQNIRAAEIHGNRTLQQRRASLSGFKKGTCRVLVATDIASRGIDVSGIALVINYDLPDDPSDYVHRIGRTGRADSEGRAISFATPTQASDIRKIEKLISSSLKRTSHSAIDSVSLEKSSKDSKPRKGARKPFKKKTFGKKFPKKGGKKSFKKKW